MLAIILVGIATTFVLWIVGPIPTIALSYYYVKGSGKLQSAGTLQEYPY